ncbi:MAG: DUF2865 domain-containing protein [Pseudomonadota bacterium]
MFAVSLTITPNAAHAQSNQCRALERQLANLSRGGGSNRFTKAVRRQQAELQKARRQARARGCGRNARSNSCRARLNLVARMEKNLVSLQRKARAESGGSTAERRRITRRLRALNCNATIRQVKPGNNRSLVEQIFGTSEVRDNGRENRSNSQRRSVRRGGTYRTMCVRTCDGYYFPISFSTTRSYFDSDADACNQRCPATQTELFVHAMPSGSPEDMISHRSGDAYTGKPFAFKYREEKVENCTCGAASSGLQAIAGQSLRPDDAIKDFPNGVGAQPGDEFSFVRPDWRPAPNVSPESALNALGQLTLAKAKDLLKVPDPVGDNVASADQKTIRVVGPQFFPDQ